MIKFHSSAKFDKEATVILLSQEQVTKRDFSHLSKALQEQVSTLSKSKKFAGEKGEILPLISARQTILLVGLGQSAKANFSLLRMVIGNVFRSAFLKKAKEIEIIPHEQKDPVVIATIEGFIIGIYEWRKYQTKEKNDKTPPAKTLFIVAPSKKIYDEATTISKGVNLARDLINENADVTTPVYLEKVIKDIVRGKKNVRVEILNQKELKAKGLGLHLAVSQGSNKEPKLIIVKYSGDVKPGNYTALIGKGLTFDTGGLNLKTTGHIETMRCDMSGAAAVIATLKNTLELKLRKNVIFAVGIAENAIGPASFKPGDVYRAYSGKTVEIGNTDAEGRLVLADAIAYVAKNYKPVRIIDIATLTGACVVALGFDYTGLVAPDDDFARQIVRASNATDDRVWRLPSYPEIKNYVKSKVADIKNTSTIRGGGTITAAEFLRQFTNDIPWAHLDIAGTAFVAGKGPLHYTQGATGAGVKLLTEYLRADFPR